MENIFYIEDKKYKLGSNIMPYEISFFKDHSFFMVLDNFVNFVKGCEKFIRKTNDYNSYVGALKEIGLTKCQVLGNIDSSLDEVDVEMHHGPIFTLFDYCSCIVNYLLGKGECVTTPMVAKIIMDEHWLGNIQTVMLSTTVHQAVDSGKLFISLNQAHGNLNEFLKKYKSGLRLNQCEKINQYIEMSKKYKSTDNGLFELKDTIYDWSKRRKK
jgi:hypothetical protein